MTGPILFEKVIELHRLLLAESPKPLKTSYGYQWRFCNRCEIKSLAIVGETVSADVV